VIVPAQRGFPSGVPVYAAALQKGFESMGHRCDIINAWTEDGYRLPAFDYIVVAAEAPSFFSRKPPEALAKILASGSSLAGKKSAAFLGKRCFFISKALSNIMSAMEKEGLVVNWSEALVSAEHAEALAKRIGA
jgi:hypothetical protein